MRPRIGRRIALAAVVLSAACSSPTSDGGLGPDDAFSCAPVATVANGPIRVVATVAPITNIVSVIAAGSDVEVVGIVPEGVNSHTYEPSPGAAAALEGADVVFLNGLDLEARTEQLAAANVDRGSVICELGDEILPESDYIFDFSFPESAGAPNPHLWTNPPMARAYAAVVRDVLSTIDPEHAELFAENDAAFAARVEDLDAAVREATASLPPDDRLLLTYHDAYAYFAEEYGWTIVGAIQPSSFNEPTPRELAALIEQVRASGVTAIFGSEVFPSPVLAQIAAETGVDYVDDLRDDDLPGDPGGSEHSWLGLMRANLVTIVEALNGDAGLLRELDVVPSEPDRATYAR